MQAVRSAVPMGTTLTSVLHFSAVLMCVRVCVCVFSMSSDKKKTSERENQKTESTGVGGGVAEKRAHQPTARFGVSGHAQSGIFRIII
uniref:Uncharacterized protein n=1 Tax=Anopheles albimanus TaxID=7167 RepID=A0A182FZ11_ANOAL